MNTRESTTPDNCEQGAERVGERQRQQPAENGQPQRAAADALEVDLVAGEEEEHAQAEAREELEEVVWLGQAQQLGADHDAEHDLDDHNRQWQAGPATSPANSAASAATTTIARKDSLSTFTMEPGDSHAPGDGLMPQGLGERLAGLQAHQGLAAPERVRRAGHRLHGEAAPVDVGRAGRR